MPKKLLVILGILAIVGAGGYFGVRAYLTQQQREAAAIYDASSDKPADELIHALIDQDVDGAYALFSPALQQGYSKDYWAKTFFPRFKDYPEWPIRSKKESAQFNANGTPAYSADDDSVRYDYDFTFSDLTYRVTFVVYKDSNGQWLVNELGGAFLP